MKNVNSLNLKLTGTAAGTCTLELVIDAGIATGMVCPLGRCNRSGNGPGTGLRKTKKGKLKSIFIPITAALKKNSNQCKTNCKIYF